MSTKTRIISSRCKPISGRVNNIMTGSGSHGNGGKYFYYHCQAKTGCKHRIKADDANLAFIEQLRTIEIKSDIISLYEQMLLKHFKSQQVDKAHQLKEVQKEIEVLQTRIKMRRFCYWMEG